MLKTFLKQSVLRVAEFSGFNRFFRWKTRNRLLGLCYHGVIGDDAPWDDPRTRIAVSETQFELQMRELHRHWHPISLSRLDELYRANEKIPEKSVFVTFDDGFRNNLTKAAPILSRHGIPATVFLTTDLIGTENTLWPLELYERVLHFTGKKLPCSLEPLPDETSARRDYAGKFIEACKNMPQDDCRKIVETLRQESDFRPRHRWQHELYEMLDWDEARKLLEIGIEIGAHTVTHCNLAKLPPEEAEEELRQSKSAIEGRLGIDCLSMAYPFGHSGAFSDDVVEIVKKLGFRVAVTLCQRRNAVVPDPLRLDRLCVTGDLSLASFRSLIAGWRV